MAISRLNHAVLYVRDVARTVTFYRDVLGFTVKHELPGGMGAFLQAPDSTNDHDIAFFGIGAAAGDSQAGRATVGLYHLAWEVQTLDDLEEHAARLAAGGVGPEEPPPHSQPPVLPASPLRLKKTKIS